MKSFCYCMIVHKIVHKRLMQGNLSQYTDLNSAPIFPGFARSPSTSSSAINPPSACDPGRANGLGLRLYRSGVEVYGYMSPERRESCFSRGAGQESFSTWYTTPDAARGHLSYCLTALLLPGAQKCTKERQRKQLEAHCLRSAQQQHPTTKGQDCRPTAQP